MTPASVPAPVPAGACRAETGRAPLAHDPALDGLRGVAIALVLLAHGGLQAVVPGGLGVTAFFALSGFLITTRLLDERARDGRIALGRFALRRALRLLPASTAFVLAGGAAYVLLTGAPLRPLAAFAALADVANGAEVFTRLFDAAPGPVPHPYVILWSLAIEEHAYLIWPPVLALVLARARRPHAALALLLAAVCAASPLWRAHLAPLCERSAALCGFHPSARIYKGTDTRLDGIAWGALAAVLRAKLPAKLPAKPAANPAALPRRRSAAWALASLAGCALLLAPSLAIRAPLFRDTLRYTLEGAAFALLIPWLADAAHPLRRVLCTRGAVATGRLSYGLYLWHWLALMVASRLSAPGGLRFVLLYAALSPALALLSWHGIERPCLGLRRRFGAAVPSGPGRADSGASPAALAHAVTAPAAA